MSVVWVFPIVRDEKTSTSTLPNLTGGVREDVVRERSITMTKLWGKIMCCEHSHMIKSSCCLFKIYFLYFSFMTMGMFVMKFILLFATNGLKRCVMCVIAVRRAVWVTAVMGVCTQTTREGKVCVLVYLVITIHHVQNEEHVFECVCVCLSWRWAERLVPWGRAGRGLWDRGCGAVVGERL